MTRIGIFSLLSTLLGSACAEDTSAWYAELGVGLMDEDILVAPGNVEPQDQLIPSVSIGLGYSHALAPDWLLETSMTLEHARGDVWEQTPQDLPQNGRLENSGLWVNSKVKYTGGFEDISPFVSVGVGRVYGRYEDNNTRISGWETGYRAFAGLEFDITPDVSFSLAVGHVEAGDIH